ncbi:hypothetical protein KP806_01555 [Paenibacillus sp. N4]|uniref:hypothetical protein n=1 Tax=Paenibacillus vietnamensis TaxID=2590547 RepID=UPI001CD119AF|nr:hypothetical protein [Paenibacillus vietnamensis]MCA0753719.1 hypothetical protein [Paenibacillus vietnamensis]
MAFSKVQKASILGSLMGVLVLGVSVAASSSNLGSYDELPDAPSQNAPLEEQKEYRKLVKKHIEKHGEKVSVSGQETKGIDIEVAGKKIKLPEDTYIDGIIVSGHVEGSSLPAYVIRKGNSSVKIGVNTGIVFDEIVDSNDSDPFKFLDAVKQDKGEEYELDNNHVH